MKDTMVYSTSTWYPPRKHHMVTFTQDFHHLLMTFIISRSDIKAKMLMSSTIDEIIEFYQGPSHFYHSYLNKVGPCIFLRGWWGGGLVVIHILISALFIQRRVLPSRRDGPTEKRLKEGRAQWAALVRYQEHHSHQDGYWRTICCPADMSCLLS